VQTANFSGDAAIIVTIKNYTFQYFLEVVSLQKKGGYNRISQLILSPSLSFKWDKSRESTVSSLSPKQVILDSDA